MDSNIIVMISGPISLYIYQIHNTKYYLFGDEHGDKVPGSCTHKSYIDINILLHNWLTYNNAHAIKTDFYLEAYFIRKHHIMRNIKDPGWINTIRNTLTFCFTSDKLKCQYTPNVNVYRADVRGLEDEKILHIDPFLLKGHLSINDDTVYDSPFTDELLIILDMFINNYKSILDGMLLDHGFDEFISKFRTIYGHLAPYLTLHYGNIFDKMINLSVIKNGRRMYLIAAEMMKLPHDVKTCILDFIYERANDIITRIKLSYMDHDIIKVIDEFVLMSNLSMDAYVLSRLLRQKDRKEIIIYAGDYHIDDYNLFFRNYLDIEPILAIPHDNDRCLIIPDLNNYIDIYKFDEYIKHLEIMRFSDIPLDDIRDFLEYNGVSGENYEMAWDIIIKGDVEFAPRSVVEFMNAYNLWSRELIMCKMKI